MSVTNSDGTVTVSPSTGAVVVSLALSKANTWTSLQTFNAGITGSGSTGGLTTGSGILGTAGTWTARQTFPTGSTGGIILGTNKLLTEQIVAGASAAFGLLYAEQNANSAATMGIMPNGTALTSQFMVFRTSSAATNYEGIALGTDISGVNTTNIYTLKGGTGTIRPMVFGTFDQTTFLEAFRITTAPIFQFSSGLAHTITSISGNYTVAIGDLVILDSASGAANTVTLPAASNQKGRYLVIVKTDSTANAVTVSRTGTDTIEGATTKSLAAQYSKITLVSDGTSVWYDLTGTLV